MNVCDLCFYVDTTGRFVVVVVLFFWLLLLVVVVVEEAEEGGVFTTVHIHHALSGNFRTTTEVPYPAVNHLINTNRL